MRQSRSQKTLSWLLSLICCVGFAFATPGCSVLFPNGGDEVNVPDDDKKPDPNPSDTFNAHSGIAKALGRSAATRADCITLYGVFTGVADFVEMLPADTDLTTTSLGAKMNVMLPQVGWPQNKYTDTKTEISRVWVALGFKDKAGMLSDSATKQKLVAAYRNMALGAKDAAAKAK